MKKESPSQNSYLLSFVGSESQTGSPLTDRWGATTPEMEGTA